MDVANDGHRALTACTLLSLTRISRAISQSCFTSASAKGLQSIKFFTHSSHFATTLPSPPRVGADGVAFVAFAATSPTAGVSSCDAGARLFSRFSTTLDMFLSAPVVVFFAGNSSSVPVPLSSPKPLGVEPGSSVFRRWSAKKKQLQSHACRSSVPLSLLSKRGEKEALSFFLPLLLIYLFFLFYYIKFICCLLLFIYYIFFIFFLLF